MSPTPLGDERDRALMARALELAQRGLYSTRPNPVVGCVIERDGQVEGEGWHERAGGPHAEVFALRQAGENVCFAHVERVGHDRIVIPGDATHIHRRAGHVADRQ